MLNPNNDIEELTMAFKTETRHKEISKLIGPLLRNWRPRDDDGSVWWEFKTNFEVIFEKLLTEYFSGNLQHKDFTFEDKEMLVSILKFLQRAVFFKNVTSIKEQFIFPYILSFDSEVSLQAFKLIISTNQNYVLVKSTNLIEVLYKLANIEDLQLEKLTTSSKFDCNSVKNLLSVYSKSDTPVFLADFYLGHLEKDIFYNMKRVYAFLLFKDFVKQDSINKKRIENFCEEQIDNIKKLLQEKEKEECVDNELIDELVFCRDNLIIYLISLKLEKRDLFRHLDVESVNEYCKKVLNYKEHTTFEEILSLKIFQELLGKEENVDLKLIVKEKNPDFDFVYLKIVYEYIESKSPCIEKKVVELDEFNNIISNLEKYVNTEDRCHLQSIFKIMDQIYFTNHHLLPKFESSLYLSKLSKLIDPNRPILSNLCLKTCLNYIEKYPNRVNQIIKRGNLKKILTPDFYKIELFGSICTLIKILANNSNSSEWKPLSLSLLKILSDVFSSKNSEIIEKDALSDFKRLLEGKTMFVTVIFDYRNIYLTSISERQSKFSENEIINDVNFFRLFTFTDKKCSLYTNFLEKNIECNLATIDKILYNMPNSGLWLEEFAVFIDNIYPEHSNAMYEIQNYYFLRKIVDMLPEINNINIEEIESSNELFSKLEIYLWVMCNATEYIENCLNWDEKYLKMYNILLNITLNLMPCLYRFRSLFLLHSNKVSDFYNVAKERLDINGSSFNLLGCIWNELSYLLNVVLGRDEDENAEMLHILLDFAYRDKISKCQQNDLFYPILYQHNINELKTEFAVSIGTWIPNIRNFELEGSEIIGFKKVFWDIAKAYMLDFRYGQIKNFLLWVGKRRVFDDAPKAIAKEIYDLLEKLDYEDDIFYGYEDEEVDIVAEDIIGLLLSDRTGFAKRNIRYVNSLIVVNIEYSSELESKIVDHYIKYFDHKEAVRYKKAFENVKFINKIIEMQNFESFIHNEIAYIPIFIVNNAFIKSRDYLKMLIFVFHSLTYSKITYDKELLQQIHLDPKIRNKDQDLFTEMHFNLELIPMYTKKILKTKKFDKSIKIDYCIALLKYLHNTRTIIDVKLYLRLLKFALKNIQKSNQDNTNVYIKIIVHQLLEGPYDLIASQGTFDLHLNTYKNFIHFYDVLAYFDINVLRSLLEKRIYLKDCTIKDYKYVFEKIAENVFLKLMKFGSKNPNALNLLTEIVINNPRYAKYITENFVKEIIDKYIFPVDLPDKISDDTDFDVGVVFIISCLKSDNISLQNFTIFVIKNALQDCAGPKIFNLVLILFRSLNLINVITHEKDNYLVSKKISELSGKYIISGIMDIIIEKLTNCTENDLRSIIKLENRTIRNANLEYSEYSPNWNNYNKKLSYIYEFISFVYKNYFIDTVKDNYDSRIELCININDKYYIENKTIKIKSSYNCEYNEFFKVSSIDKETYGKNDFTFRKIYTSYFLYDFSYGFLRKNYKDYDFRSKLEKLLQDEYIISNLESKIVESKEIVRGRENNDFKNLSEYQYYSMEYKTENSIEYLRVGIKNGFRPIIEWNELNFMSEDEVAKFAEEWNETRAKLYIEYYEIDIDFLKECNNMMRKIFIREEEILKAKYTIYGHPEFWPHIKTHQKEDKKDKFADPDKPAKELENLTDYKLYFYLSNRLFKLTTNAQEKHISSEFISRLNFSCASKVAKFENLISKAHSSKLYKKVIDKSKSFNNLGIKTGIINNFLEALDSKIFLWSSEISDFIKILSKTSENIDRISLIVQKRLFSLCQKEKLDFDEIKNVLTLLFSLKDEFKISLEENIYYSRLLIMLSRYNQFVEFTIPILFILKLNPKILTDFPLFSEEYKINIDLINIPEICERKKILWIFKAILKGKLTCKVFDMALKYIVKNTPKYFLTFTQMCLDDLEMILESMSVIHDFCTQHLLCIESKNKDKILTVKKYHTLPNVIFTKLNYQYLKNKGVFTQNHKILRISLFNYDRFYELIQRKDLSTKNFVLLFQMYERFINLLSLVEVKNRKKIIEKFDLIRNQLEKEMEKEKDTYNQLVLSDPKLTSFLVNFSFISFTNKKKYLRNQIQLSFSKQDPKNIKAYKLNISRSNIVANSFTLFSQISIYDQKYAKLAISFKGEEGVDQGGLTKEWLESLAKDISNQDYGLFTFSSDNSISLIPFKDIIDDNLKYFKFVGWIMGKAILDGYNFPLNLDKTVYKFILNKKCDLSDLESVDPQFYKSLVWMRDNSIKDVLHLTFTYENNVLGEVKIEDLKLNGKDIPVTDENKEEYIELIIQKKFLNNIHSQLKAIKIGFNDIINENIVNVFNEKELELLICGIPEIDVEDWKSNTVYINYDKYSKNILWFWEVVEQLSNEERGKLLHFCTGSSRVPYDGFSNLQGNGELQKFRICKINTKRLPSAHTCINQLDLPEYSSYEELRKNVIYAIDECHGTYGFA